MLSKQGMVHRVVQCATYKPKYSDITSYNDAYPTDKLPEYTFLYYMRKPDSGGELEIGSPEWTINKTFAPEENRLLYFERHHTQGATV